MRSHVPTDIIIQGYIIQYGFIQRSSAKTSRTTKIIAALPNFADLKNELAKAFDAAEKLYETRDNAREHKILKRANQTIRNRTTNARHIIASALRHHPFFKLGNCCRALLRLALICNEGTVEDYPYLGHFQCST